MVVSSELKPAQARQVTTTPNIGRVKARLCSYGHWTAHTPKNKPLPYVIDFEFLCTDWSMFHVHGTGLCEQVVPVDVASRTP